MYIRYIKKSHITHNFWENVRKEIADITSIDLSLKPEVFLLNYWDNDVDARNREIISMLLAAARTLQLDIESKMLNFTSTSEFLLLEFSDIRELQILYFFVFLAVYATVVISNLLIIIAVVLDHHLHTPMYFFLMNLAVLDLGSVSVTVPKAIANSLLNTRSISYSGCVAQVFVYVLFAGSNFALLTVMAHDRYVAICSPLQYETIMHKGACIRMAASAWFVGILNATLHTSGTFAITFCSNIINQFFCEVPQIVKLSCSNLYLIEIGILLFSCSLVGGCFIYIIITYMQIFATVLRMPSVQGRKKALSTCLPHLTVVSLLVVTAVFAYLRPPAKTSSDLDILFAVIYVILPPLLNPFIYSMRNKDIKIALWKILRSPSSFDPIRSSSSNGRHLSSQSQTNNSACVRDHYTTTQRLVPAPGVGAGICLPPILLEEV
ncbi:PREDICTED: olfactory receptor 14I1-like [Gekko japonicus]|uniref:Olfactory receptor 14I1-like n=1 Tax=Gekko japonicus TaxID=146911 RepID=A0ABM1KNV3_GEKJA|nr:PREDICTED: olfactory receptor 14I1-like [Gekko japonicus]